MAVLDAASDGRAFLGLARGALARRARRRLLGPVTAIRETWEIVRRLLAGDESGFAGRRFSLAAGARLRFALRRARFRCSSVRGRRDSPRSRARRRTELKVGGSANPDMVPVMRERHRQRRRRHRARRGHRRGRGRRARARAARDARWRCTSPWSPSSTRHSRRPRGRRGIRDRVDANDHEGAGALISDDVLDRFAFAGTPAQIAGTPRPSSPPGARRVEFGTPHGIDERRGVELRRDLPRLRASRLRRPDVDTEERPWAAVCAWRQQSLRLRPPVDTR